MMQRRTRDRQAPSDQFFWAIWIRLPQVSSNTAVVVGPKSIGS